VVTAIVGMLLGAAGGRVARALRERRDGVAVEEIVEG
jgi:hypothetical protein